LNIAKVAGIVARMKLEQWSDQEQIEELQEKRLKSLISHCAANVPRYKGYGLRGMDGLASFQPITKKELRDHPESFMARGVTGTLHPHSSSGSTGIPITVYHSDDDDAFSLALDAHQLTEAGLSPFNLQARVCDYRLGAGIMQKAGIFRRQYLSVQDGVGKLHSRLLSIHASVLHCYPSIMASLARYNNALGKKLRFRLAFSTAEAISPMAREVIADSFGCDLRNIYGSSEMSWVAWECEKGSMHIHPSTLVEVVDTVGTPLGKGKEGGLLVTPLWKRTMPLIRYRIGDMGSLGGKCSCGRGTQTLASISGRDDDYITLPSGVRVSARSFNIMDDVPGLREYQIVQEEIDLIVFRYRPSSPLSDAWRKEIAARITRSCLGERMKIELQERNMIERENRGKLRTVISKVRT
jgi:phenylacetate-CoA ligase